MKGVYLFLMKNNYKKKIEIGALGEKTFLPGIYVYCGSARNSVEKRLQRHFSEPENRHWHIDYLSSELEARDYFILPEKSKYECVMAEILGKSLQPVEGFGSSDCECGSHLFKADANQPDFISEE